MIAPAHDMKMLIGRVLLALGAAGMLFVQPAHAVRKAFVVDHVGIKVVSPDGSPQPPAEIRSAIIAGADRHGWKVKQDTPEKIQLERAERNGAIWVTVEVSYRAGSFDIRYGDSAGLEYASDDQGRRVISRNYQKWVDNLVSTISKYALRISGQSFGELEKK